MNWISSYCTIWTRLPLGSRMSKKRPGKHLHAGFLERAAGGLLVVDDESEVRLLGARPPLEQGEELVAHAEKRGARDAAHRRGLEEVGVERDRLLDVVDLERDVVDPDETWLHAATNDGGGGACPLARVGSLVSL